MPYLVVTEKNCFRCTNLGASDAGYICKMGFGKAQTIWTGHLASALARTRCHNAACFLEANRVANSLSGT